MFRAISHMRSPLTLRSISQTLSYLAQPSLFSSSPKHSPSFFKLLIDPSHSIPPIANPSFPSPFSQHSQLRHRHEGANADDEFNRDPKSPPKLFVVQPRLRPDKALQTKLDEALNLANSLEEQRDGYYETEFSEKELPPHVVVQNPLSRSPHADTYFGPGTVKTVECHLNAVESKDGLDAVFVNAILTGIQQRNLERAWGKPVLDRVGLIIEIFNAHAQTKEAKLQAELAALMYKKTRLVRLRGPKGRYTFGAVGEAEVVSARGRGSGGRGFISGAGEPELQLQRRRILERRNQLISEIKEVRRTRALQRAARRRHGDSLGQDMATVAVVGYTNAGKSTLVSTLSDSYLYSDDRLFATVDPKLRSVILPSGRKVLLSDTVGFISELPVKLVEAFHATLEEVVEADLLVHVLDSSASNLEEQRETVLRVLGQIGVSKEKLQNMIEVWNKIDVQEEMGADEYGEENEVSGYSGLEDDDVVSEQLSGEDDDTIVSGLSSGDLEGTRGDEQGDCSDGWLLPSDREETWDDQRNESSKDWRIIEKDCQSQPESISVIKTSADGIASEQLSGEDVDEYVNNDDTIVSGLSSGDLEGTRGDEQGDYSDGWLLPSDREETWDDHDGYSMGREALNDQRNESPKDYRIIERDSQSQPESVSVIKISAIMGDGLQELLELIDERLKTQKGVERSIFDRKWRPPRAEDTGIAVEQ